MSVLYSASSVSATAPAAFPGAASGAERTLSGRTAASVARGGNAAAIAAGGHAANTSGGCS